MHLIKGPYSSKRLLFCALMRVDKTTSVQLAFLFLFFSDTSGSKSSVTLSDLPEFLGGLSFEDSAEKDREEGNFCHPYIHLSQRSIFNRNIRFMACSEASCPVSVLFSMFSTVVFMWFNHFKYNCCI